MTSDPPSSPSPSPGRVLPRRRLTRLAIVWLVGAAVLRTTIMAPEVCPPADPETLHASAVAAGRWIVDTQAPDGTYLYEYDRATDEAAGTYNLVRHAGTTMSLYQLDQAGESWAREAADLATSWMLEQEIDTGGGGVAWAGEGEDAKLGAAALLAVSLLTRRDTTGETTYDETLRGLGRFMVGQQLPNGAMLETWDASTGAPDPTRTSRYATGEALWAIAQLHGAFPGEGWDEPAWVTLDYLSTRRDIDEGVWPRPWPDQWAAYSLEEMGSWGLDDTHIAYARDLAAAFGVQVRWDAQRDGIGTWSHPPEPRGAGFGTVLEGSAMLQRLASQDERMDDLASALADRLECGAVRQADRQVTADETTGSSPALEVGAWFVADVTRVDDQQHAISGLLWAEQLLTTSGTTGSGDGGS